MAGTSFLRRVSLHGFRASGSKPKLDESKPVLDNQISDTTPVTPETQTVLLLHGARQPYQLTENHPVPLFRDDREVLVRTQAIGLNPMDWKAPVIVISTDYRDIRKAAYQQYVVAPDYNTVRLPPTLSPEEGSSLGVAFVVAAISLGVCIGLDFTPILNGPDLYTLLRQLPPDTAIAPDIQQECLASIPAHERAQPGDWLAIWGGSSTSANLTLQLARLAGLRTIAVADKAKHGLWLSSHGTAARPDLLVDSHDPARAVAIMRANVGPGKLRFAVDTRGRESAGWLLEALVGGRPGGVDGEGGGGGGEVKAVVEEGQQEKGKAPQDLGSVATTHEPASEPARLPSAHLVGLTGLPKQPAPDGVVYHTVPIKLFHEVPAVGQALVEWLERLLQEGLVTPPNIIDVQRGLGSVNQGLDRMRRGEISGGKLVVRVD
ncbi:hypothetical protein B0I37DRAFT_392684 [Chaetomium sp. MPI-CAGE-AT-0009]|nr:hypothetical protein B0I37DRAFT_392684 [Chaetomium sp. MPI-CAGE-AT-0009]